MTPSPHNLWRQGAIGFAALVFAFSASAQITFYEHSNFQGRNFKTTEEVADFRSQGFNDLASSVVVLRERWEVCESAAFGGRCMVLRQGNYASLADIGFNDRISSARSVNESASIESQRYAPLPAGQAPLARDYDARRRGNERLFQARVLSTRAVLATASQRCWVEPGQAAQGRGDASVPGGVVGAVLGGILGHQIGGGRGRDIATAAGAVGGAVVGANVGRDRGQAGTADVRRCEDTAPNANARPEYWDVSYSFRGQEHRVQMTSAPGATVTVNGRGEPRV
jgi:uncharacterized protein YcfJ